LSKTGTDVRSKVKGQGKAKSRIPWFGGKGKVTTGEVVKGPHKSKFRGDKR